MVFQLLHDYLDGLTIPLLIFQLGKIIFKLLRGVEKYLALQDGALKYRGHVKGISSTPISSGSIPWFLGHQDRPPCEEGEGNSPRPRLT